MRMRLVLRPKCALAPGGRYFVPCWGLYGWGGGLGPSVGRHGIWVSGYAQGFDVFGGLLEGLQDRVGAVRGLGDLG